MGSFRPRQTASLRGHSLLGRAGITLMELMIVIAVMGIVMLGMMSMMSNQVKSNNYLEFQLKRTQLQNTLIAQFLDEPENCACLFFGANNFSANPAAPGATLTGVNPTEIGIYQFSNPGDCSTATVPVPLVGSNGIDNIRATNIQLSQIRNVSGKYTGNFVVTLETTKDVMGPNQLNLEIPVNVEVIPVSASSVAFQSCTSAAIGSPTTIHYVRSCIWSGAGTSPSSCAPPACDGGDEDLGVGCEASYLLHGGSSGYKGGNCHRTCKTKASSKARIRTVSCPWTHSTSGPYVTCTPNSCAAGEVDQGVYCELSGSAPGGCCGTAWGSCKRQCLEE